MAEYNHKDVMQALAAALMFHEDIGLAARDEQGGQLHPGAGNTVFMSDQAADLLREAWAIVEGSEYGDAMREDHGNGYSSYDLRNAITEKAETPIQTVLTFDFDRYPSSAKAVDEEGNTSYGANALAVFAKTVRETGMNVEITQGTIWNTATLTATK